MSKEMYIYNIKTGHARFETVAFTDGSIKLQVYQSNKKVPIGVDLSIDELWGNQEITPVFAIHCESIEQLEAYKKVFEDAIQSAKKQFAYMSANKETKNNRLEF